MIAGSAASEDQIKCTCFNVDDLSRITNDNLNKNNSCDPSDGYKIFQSNPVISNARVAPGRSMGYSVMVSGEDSRCLIQGDIMKVVSEEEAYACLELLMERCLQLGFAGFSHDE